MKETTLIKMRNDVRILQQAVVVCLKKIEALEEKSKKKSKKAVDKQFICEKYFVDQHYKQTIMNYTDFIYSQYTMQELTDIVAKNKHHGDYLDSQAKRCRLEIIKRHQEEQEIIQL